MKKLYAVIGLGRFGSSVCKALMKQGVQVMAIDQDEKKIDDCKDKVTHAVVANSTDEKALRALGISLFDHVIVAIGDNIQASILTTLMLDELGVKHITVKAQNDYHERVLSKIGADKIVHPERDMGVRIAHHLVSKNVLDYLEISDSYSIFEVVVSNKMHNQSLLTLNIRALFGCNVLAIKRGNCMIVSPKASEYVFKGDILILIGADEDFMKFELKMLDDE